jgi:hypothetical protein
MILPVVLVVLLICVAHGHQPSASCHKYRTATTHAQTTVTQLYPMGLHEFKNSLDAVTHAYILYYIRTYTFTTAGGAIAVPALNQQWRGSSASTRGAEGSASATSSNAQQAVRYAHIFSGNTIKVVCDQVVCVHHWHNIYWQQQHCDELCRCSLLRIFEQ